MPRSCFSPLAILSSSKACGPPLGLHLLAVALGINGIRFKFCAEDERHGDRLVTLVEKEYDLARGYFASAKLRPDGKSYGSASYHFPDHRPPRISPGRWVG